MSLFRLMLSLANIIQWYTNVCYNKIEFNIISSFYPQLYVMQIYFFRLINLYL